MRGGWGSGAWSTADVVVTEKEDIALFSQVSRANCPTCSVQQIQYVGGLKWVGDDSYRRKVSTWCVGVLMPDSYSRILTYDTSLHLEVLLECVDCSTAYSCSCMAPCLPLLLQQHYQYGQGPSKSGCACGYFGVLQLTFVAAKTFYSCVLYQAVPAAAQCLQQQQQQQLPHCSLLCCYWCHFQHRIVVSVVAV